MFSQDFFQGFPMTIDRRDDTRLTRIQSMGGVPFRKRFAMDGSGHEKLAKVVEFL
jgi:hypothetical protein